VVKYKVPSNYIKKILWVCFASLNVDDVNLQDFIPRKDLGKNRKKGDNFGNFIRLFELLLICETTGRRCLGHKICKGGISSHNAHKHLNPIFGE